MSNKDHWEKIYSTKEIDGVSWYQETPTTSLNIIDSLKLNLNTSIIDIGAGKSFLADNLLDLGYNDITILDISRNALNEVTRRVGKKNHKIKCIESNVIDLSSGQKYDVWHDRAVFHFITNNQEREKYLDLLNSSLNKDGCLIIGTFSEDGPLKCSGLEVQRYSVKDLRELLKPNFKFIDGFKEIHDTPFNTSQSFTFCTFKKIK
ncbi:MAG: class I SAM-dependent methyltransferase [Flavobacteriaceae bacterium]|jgi:2-polyprenyl-3-methyl-5-hydroxy-6-metoxy-1,4-benzoquinol methylase|nr:class I SAM-dependent methyltransferase [Flavobacteriaceae bacterium]MBT4113629.1 class I SAM-dependent methyltransferase [Flavobacteriaceae bacterium]MBT4614057.1 class I SAM-dependent methyltransferase [Flavobacteriaceae bacterium]MBT5246600.1 class I SAM-dependent methyltransferase [Flavobacteriaceae bacterium]MBT5650316.1 class I SAM-dependent methyltransferase [Flavobacteriaceae bacterium]